MIRKRIELILASIIIVFSVILIATENNEVKKNVELEIIPINRSDGTVDFQVRTISYNGAYAPAHCLAIWVCDENDNFIRTIVRRALSYSQHLVKWNQITNGVYINGGGILCRNSNLILDNTLIRNNSTYE